MTIEYDTSHGLIYTAFGLKGTIIPDVTRRWDFWFLLLIHTGLGVGFRTGYLTKEFGSDFGREHTVFGINWNDIKVITAMTTFFEVFYTNQCFSRYLELYRVTGKIQGLMYDLIIALRIYMGKTGYAYTKLAVRFALVAIFLNFYEVHHGEGVSDEEWKVIMDHGLLKMSERDMLVGLKKHQRSHVLLYWAADVSKEGMQHSKSPGNALKQVLSPILSMREDQQELLNTAALPIPFQYYHLLNAMVLFNLILWGYAMAICESCFASLIYVMCSLIFMGMLELADELSDPFGDDPVDFPVMEWLEELLDGCHILMHRNYTGCENGWEDTTRAEASRGKMSLRPVTNAPVIQWPWLTHSAREFTPNSNQARSYLPLVQQTPQKWILSPPSGA